MSIKFVVKFATGLMLASFFSSFCGAQQTTQSPSADLAARTQSENSPVQDSTSAAPRTLDSAKDSQPSPTDGQGQPTGQNGQTDTPQGKSQTQEQTGGSSGSASGTSNDRLFFALPNFLTLENAGHIAPLTAGQKFKVVARSSFDYVIVPWYGLLSGLSQAEDSEPGFGQGAEGYGKRYAASFADGTIENFMVGAVMPSLLHQDPRYYQSGKGGFWRRTFYAASRNVVTLSDSGKKEFNYSEVVGGALSASISTFSYHPTSKTFPTPTPGVVRYIPSDRTLPNAAKVWGTQYAYDTLTLVVKEFWPDIRRILSHKHHADADLPRDNSRDARLFLGIIQSKTGL